jgi:hypothetical protein
MLTAVIVGSLCAPTPLGPDEAVALLPPGRKVNRPHPTPTSARAMRPPARLCVDADAVAGVCADEIQTASARDGVAGQGPLTLLPADDERAAAAALQGLGRARQPAPPGER